MRITILTLFPEMFVGPLSESIVKRAQEKGSVEIKLVNIRDFGLGAHKVVDDKPYGGGIGMVMKVDVIDAALQSVKYEKLNQDLQKVVLLDPRGRQFKQPMARAFSKLEHLILLCAHYEGVDERVRSLVDETVSIGDFVVTGGEIPAMLITDAVVRLVSGVLKDDATVHESFEPHPNPLLNPPAGGGEGDQGQVSLLEYPQYTTPNDYNGQKVPPILLSGNHQEIDKWRKDKAVELTRTHRPDLLKNTTEN